MGRQWLHAKRAIVNLKKGQVVGKLVKEITVAAKLGGGDPAGNARLFAVLEKARKANVTREAIERAVAYVEAGADMVFPEAMRSLDDYRKVKAAVKVPVLANLTEFGSTPFFTTDELRDAGVDIALYCCGAYRAMNKAALHFYETVRREGTQKNIIDTLQTRAELYDFLGYHAYEDKLDQLFAQEKKED